MRTFTEIVETIAKENNTTPELVLQQMQEVIDVAYEHHEAAAQPFWDALYFKGTRPTPEEFVVQLTWILQADKEFGH